MEDYGAVAAEEDDFPALSVVDIDCQSRLGYLLGAQRFGPAQASTLKVKVT